MRRLRPAGYLALVLGFSLIALTLLCHASPPDPTWIAGLYDDADHDDVVLGVVGTVAVPPAEPPQVRLPIAARTAPPASPGEIPTRPGLLARVDRAPPLV
jgi:hypothetical protein